MTPSLPKTPEWRNVDLATFRNEIVPRNRPAILRGLISNWPAVRAGATSAREMALYLQRFDCGQPFVTLEGEPAIKGRFFYGESLRSVNFKRRREPFAAALERILALVDQPTPPAIFIQSASIAEFLTDFVRENALDLLNASINPRIWIGNSVAVHTHYDPYDNIACAVAGRRRFTFFPPEQLPNMYPGPIDATPSGAPVSLAPLEEPDFERFPRFKDALAAAECAELEPGDAVYVPYFWWHHVRSLDRFNVLVNYWWNEAKPYLASPFECLLHAIWALRDRPEHERNAWRAMFDYYIFQQHGEPLAHMAPEDRGLMGALTPEIAERIRQDLLRGLQQRPE